MTGKRAGTVAVAMSGGLDSTAALAYLLDEGCEAFGLTALMTRERSRCCAPEDVEAASLAARRLGVEHHVVPVYEEFEGSVIGHFSSEYLAGRTPSPCVVCNRTIKFGALLEEAARLGADFLATGHYARTERTESGAFRLLRGSDPAKDQSYFLARLTQRQLARALFPLGIRTKREVASDMARRGLAFAPRGESQELCFVGDDGHGAWLDVRILNTPPPGRIVSEDGRILGRHNGIHHYTVGQRKGLGIATGEPVYVTAIRPDTNEVVVGARDRATVHAMRVADFNWISGIQPASPVPVETQYRFRQNAAASVLEIAGDAGNVTFEARQFGVAPGQSAAFYRGPEALGAAWIASTSR
ncbi:MAG: tRNA 2-thiouridine(34) synthase MnmA [Lentisphaerae bacterium]|nr:tRNA 2-thiouridine(34) synthase MnmA [Lentisphaerota bacterium]